MKIYNQLLKESFSCDPRLFSIKRIKTINGFLGIEQNSALNSNALLHHNSKSVVYSFKKVNNLSPLLTKTEYLLKSTFRSMFSLISRPIYLIKHDKIIIQLFVYLSPKLDKYLDTSTIGKSYTDSTKETHNKSVEPRPSGIGRSSSSAAAPQELVTINKNVSARERNVAGFSP